MSSSVQPLRVSVAAINSEYKPGVVIEVSGKKPERFAPARYQEKAIGAADVSV